MSREIDAVYEGGVFRPASPVDYQEGQRVRLTVRRQPTEDDPTADLIAEEFMESIRQYADPSVSIEEVRERLSKIKGPISKDIREERDES